MDVALLGDFLVQRLGGIKLAVLEHVFSFSGSLGKNFGGIDFFHDHIAEVVPGFHAHHAQHAVQFFVGDIGTGGGCNFLAHELLEVGDQDLSHLLHSFLAAGLIKVERIGAVFLEFHDHKHFDAGKIGVGKQLSRVLFLLQGFFHYIGEFEAGLPFSDDLILILLAAAGEGAKDHNQR